MFEAFRVGPVDSSEGKLSLYAACSPAGAVTAIAADDRSGLAELRKRAPAGVPSCEPALAAAGASLGFVAASLSVEARHARATFATMLRLGDTVESRIIEQVPQTIEVAQRFLAARPWQLVRPEVAVELTIVLGSRELRLAASVLGADRIEHGIVLHDSAASMARFVELVEADRDEEARQVATRGLSVDREPAWVAEAVKAAFGDAIVIVPVATGVGGRCVVTSEDLTLLVAAMFAISKLGPGRFTADVTIEVEGGGQCRATARIADRGAVTASPLPGWAARPMRAITAVPAGIMAVPVLAVSDLSAAVAGLRALGFTVTESAEPRIATAVWPGIVLELVHAPSTPGSGCHLVVETIDGLVDVWQQAGVELRVIEHGGERIAHVEVPGGLSLTFGDRLPAAFKPSFKARGKQPRRRTR